MSGNIFSEIIELLATIQAQKQSIDELMSMADQGLFGLILIAYHSGMTEKNPDWLDGFWKDLRLDVEHRAKRVHLQVKEIMFQLECGNITLDVAESKIKTLFKDCPELQPKILQNPLRPRKEPKK